MKILQIIQKPQLRGAEIFACQLSLELIKLGHEVNVAYLFSGTAFDLDFDLKFINLHASRKKRFFDWKALRNLNGIIRTERYDIVQTNAGDTLKYAVLSKNLFGWDTPLVCRNANKMTAMLRSSLQRMLNRWLLSKVDYVVSVSENCRKDIVALYPPLKEKSATVTIGTYNFDNVPEADDTTGRPVIINVSSFVPEKNHEFLLEVFREFRTRHPHASLWLVGDGKLRDKLEQKVSKLQLDEAVHFFGYQKNIIRLLKCADMMLMPSKVEGLPGVILEAFSCRIPVIASAVGGIPEVVRNGVTGYCIDRWEISHYIEAMELVMKKDVRQHVTTNAKQLVNDQFLMPQISRRFMEQYAKLVNEKI